MSGAPREAYAPRKFIIISLAAVKALGSWEAAGCFQRIAYKAERDGYWRATMQEVADEIEVSVRTAHRITKKLREVGWVTAERENTWESTLTWRPIFEDGTANVAVPDDDEETAGQSTEGQGDTPDNANVAASGSPDVAAPQGANLALAHDANLAPSLFSETDETKEETSDVPSDGDASGQRHLAAVPDGASSTPTIDKRADVERLCEHLADRIEGNTGKRPTITQKWRDAARRMIDIDGHSEQHIHGVIDWCQNDSFWCSNILSMPKLREQYIQMKLQGERRTQRHTGPAAHREPADSPGSVRRRQRLGGS
jgi:hypothetical protein